MGRQHADLGNFNEQIRGVWRERVHDEASDVDCIVAVAAGSFTDAWELRATLETTDALVGWDFRPDVERQVGSHKFLTRDLVKVELSMGTPSSGMRLADPFVVLVGDESVADTLQRVEPIPPDVLAEYARKLREDGLVPEVEMRYHDLMDAIRAEGM